MVDNIKAMFDWAVNADFRGSEFVKCIPVLMIHAPYLGIMVAYPILLIICQNVSEPIQWAIYLMCASGFILCLALNAYETYRG